MKDLGGKIAFVTGGSSGIGLGLVKALAAAGMKVAFTYRQPQHRDEALEHFHTLPDQRVHAIPLDVTDRAGFKTAADEAERVLAGPVQVLINNAGVGVHGLMEHATYADWDWVMGVNLGGVVNGVQTFLPRMLASGLPGHIVNVSSIGGIAALGSVGLYATSNRYDRQTHRRVGVLPGTRQIQYRRQRAQPPRAAGAVRLCRGRPGTGRASPGVHAAGHGRGHRRRLCARRHPAQPPVHHQPPGVPRRAHRTQPTASGLDPR
jgi:hypothetical protein